MNIITNVIDLFKGSTNKVSTPFKVEATWFATDKTLELQFSDDIPLTSKESEDLFRFFVQELPMRFKNGSESSLKAQQRLITTSFVKITPEFEEEIVGLCIKLNTMVFAEKAEP